MYVWPRVRHSCCTRHWTFGTQLTPCGPTMHAHTQVLIIVVVLSMALTPSLADLGKVRGPGCCMLGLVWAALGALAWQLHAGR